MSTPASRPGHALVGTMVFLVLVMLIWTAVMAQTASYLRVEKACRNRQLRAAGPTRAMTWALALLESGLPPTDTYACRAVLAGPPASTYVLSFRLAEEMRYDVYVRQAEAADASLPEAPPAFTRPPPRSSPRGGRPRRW